MNKHQNISGLSFLHEEYPESWDEFYQKYGKRSFRKPGLWLFVILSFLIYISSLVVTSAYYHWFELEGYLITALSSGFLSVFLFSLFRQTGPCHIVLLSLGPPWCLSLLFLFGKGSIFVVFPFLFMLIPFPLLGGFIGFLTGRILSLFIAIIYKRFHSSVNYKT